MLHAIGLFFIRLLDVLLDVLFAAADLAALAFSAVFILAASNKPVVTEEREKQPPPLRFPKLRALAASKKAVVTEEQRPPRRPLLCPLHYRFVKTKCHPEANGRMPERGDLVFSAWFEVEDGSRLCVFMGREARDAFLEMLLQDNADEMATIMGRPLDPCRFRLPPG